MYVTKTGNLCNEASSKAEYAACIKDAKRFVFYREKYYCLLVSTSPEAKINNEAVKLAMDSKYAAAEILLKKVISEQKAKAAASNNIAIIYELSGRADEASRMYSLARQLEPGNAVFRKNAANMVSSRQF